MAEAVRRSKESFLPLILKGKNSRRNRFKEAENEKPYEPISEQDISRITKTQKHNISVEMLQEGNHRSFQMFFHVLDQERQRRDTISPVFAESLPLLEQQPERMHTMKRHLTSAEHAERSGSWSQMCEHFLSLGLFFSSQTDLWLRLYFLHICADREHGGSSRAAIEARAVLAEIYLQQGELKRALQYAECCLSQVEAGAWLDSSGFPLKTRAQHVLCGILTRLADEPLNSKDYVKATALLQQALSVATDSGTKAVEGEATYRMGVMYQLTGDHRTAKKYLSAYMKICDELEDASGLGKANRAMAKSLESEGNIEEMVRSLQLLMDESSRSLPRDLVEACLILGSYYYNMGELDKACECYSRGYEAAEDLKDESVLLKAQVLLGLANAQSMIRQFSSVTLSAADSSSSLRSLIKWKESREQDQSFTTNESNATSSQE